MNSWQAILLGVLQGGTEFLPVSSSGHLVLLEKIFGLQLDPLAMLSINVLLHAGTLLALLYMYRTRWYALLTSVFTKNVAQQKLLCMIILATLPAVVIGLLWGSAAAHLSSTTAVAINFLITACVLWAGERARGTATTQAVGSQAALGIGLAQAVALLPGLSRSGLSISAGRYFGLSRAQAMDFSFLMAVPALCGAIILTVVSLVRTPVPLPEASVLFVCFFTSFASSIVAIIFLQRFVQQKSLSWFSIYLVVLATFLLFTS